MAVLRASEKLSAEQYEVRLLCGLLSKVEAERLYFRHFRKELLERDRGTGRRSYAFWCFEGPERLILGHVPGPGHPPGPSVPVVEDETTALVRAGHATPREIRLLREKLAAWEQGGSPAARLQAAHAQQVLAELV